MLAVGRGFEIDHSDPLVDQPCTLTRSDVPPPRTPTGEQPVFWTASALEKTSRKRLPSELGYLEWSRPAGLLLNDGGSLTHRATDGNVSDTQLHEIAAAQHRVEGAVEHRQLANLFVGLELLPDRPDVLGPQRRLGAYQPTGVPELVRKTEEIWPEREVRIYLERKPTIPAETHTTVADAEIAKFLVRLKAK